MFGKILQSLRKEKGLTQKDIANLLKVSPSTIGMYEQGRREPDTETLKFLSEFFNVSIDSLLGQEEKKGNLQTWLSVKDQVKLSKDAMTVMNNLQLSLSKNKEHLNEEDYAILSASIHSAMETILLKNKEKYTPKKYKNPKK